MERYFTTDVLPFLSPQIVSSRQPFPFLANKDIYAISLLKKKGEGTFLGIVPCSASVVRRLIPVSAESGRYLLAEELIVNCSGRIFEHYQVSGSTLIRIVRNADITVDDLKGEEQKDYRRSMEKMIPGYLRDDGRISSTFSFSSIFLREVVCLLFATLAEKRRMNSSSSLRFSSAFARWFCACRRASCELWYQKL